MYMYVCDEVNGSLIYYCDVHMHYIANTYHWRGTLPVQLLVHVYGVSITCKYADHDHDDYYTT